MSLLKKLLPKIYAPDLFHTNLKRRRFFECWEHKLISNDGQDILIVIGVLILGKDRLCYNEIIDGKTGANYLVKYPIDQYKPSKTSMECQYATTRFSKEGIDLSIKNDTLSINGKITFGEFKAFPSSKLSPGLMGYFSFIPFMESYFKLVSLHHSINGKITINDKIYNFDKGSSYIEKGWGKKFPDSWLMIHCNTFTEPDTSFFVTFSPVKIIGTTIIGIQCFIMYNNEIINFSTYNNGKITLFKRLNKTLNIEIKNDTHYLDITVIPKKYGRIRIPSFRNRELFNLESSDSTVYINLLKNNNIIKSFEGKNASFTFDEGIAGLIESKI